MEIATGFLRRASACVRAAETTPDARTRALLLEEGELWIALARQSEATAELVRAIAARDAAWRGRRPAPERG